MQNSVKHNWILYSLAGIGALAIAIFSAWLMMVEHVPYIVSSLIGGLVLTTTVLSVISHNNFMHHHSDVGAIDELTGLLNRKRFFKKFQTVLSVARKNSKQFHLLLIDISNFKQINDALGHQLGDQLLQQFAQRLKASIRQHDYIARLNGDEFAILLSDSDESLKDIVSRILHNATSAITIDNRKLYLGVSVGAASYPDMGTNTSELMRKADIALGNAKRTQKDFCVYSPEEDVFVLTNCSLISEIRIALEKNEFTVWLQPKKNLLNNKIESAECLIRWNHPDRGLLFPDSFIPIAETSGIIKYLTRFVIQEATQIYKRLYDLGYDLNIAVNISPNDMSDPTIMTTVIKNVVNADMSPDSLILEVTETAIMHDPESATKILLALESLGVRLSIDDFGTGHSSLKYLKNYPIREIKFDKSFITDIESSNEGFNIVKSNIELAHVLSATTVAEGVETEHVEIVLKDLGCDYIQGYHLAKPMPVDTFITWLQERQPKEDYEQLLI